MEITTTNINTLLEIAESKCFYTFVVMNHYGQSVYKVIEDNNMLSKHSYYYIPFNLTKYRFNTKEEVLKCITELKANGILDKNLKIVEQYPFYKETGWRIKIVKTPLTYFFNDDFLDYLMSHKDGMLPSMPKYKIGDKVIVYAEKDYTLKETTIRGYNINDEDEWEYIDGYHLYSVTEEHLMSREYFDKNFVLNEKSGRYKSPYNQFYNVIFLE